MLAPNTQHKSAVYGDAYLLTYSLTHSLTYLLTAPRLLRRICLVASAPEEEAGDAKAGEARPKLGGRSAVARCRLRVAVGGDAAYRARWGYAAIDPRIEPSYHTAAAAAEPARKSPLLQANPLLQG